MKAINIITTDSEGLINENKLFIGDSAVEKAEECFKEKVRSYLYDVSDEDMDVFLEDGYYCHSGDIYIMISHADVED